MQALDSVHSPARGHFSLAVQDQIDFFRGFVVVRKIRATGREVHQKKISDRVGCVDTVTCGGTRSDEKYVEHRLRMAADCLLFQLVQVRHYQLWWLRDGSVVRNLDGGNHKPERLTRRIGDGVPNRWGRVRKIIRGQRMGFVTVAQ